MWHNIVWRVQKPAVLTRSLWLKALWADADHQPRLPERKLLNTLSRYTVRFQISSCDILSALPSLLSFVLSSFQLASQKFSSGCPTLNWSGLLTQRSVTYGKSLAAHIDTVWTDFNNDIGCALISSRAKLSLFACVNSSFIRLYGMNCHTFLYV